MAWAAPFNALRADKLKIQLHCVSV